MSSRTKFILFDNGSLRPEATDSLRRIAMLLARRTGKPVIPVSLLHSDRVDPAALGGTPAPIVEPFLKERLAAGIRRFGLVPLFFGPSGAFGSYLPERLNRLRGNYPDASFAIGPPVAVEPEGAIDRRLVAIVRDLILEAASNETLCGAPVVFVDHGSPLPEVARIRDRLAAELRSALGSQVDRIIAASMERRPGAEYDFNEPLLERALMDPGLPASPVIVAPLFFSPGRHAGPGGDIETTCRRAESSRKGLRCHMTRLVGEHPALIDILEDRVRQTDEMLAEE